MGATMARRRMKEAKSKKAQAVKPAEEAKEEKKAIIKKKV